MKEYKVICLLDFGHEGLSVPSTVTIVNAENVLSAIKMAEDEFTEPLHGRFFKAVYAERYSDNKVVFRGYHDQVDDD